MIVLKGDTVKLKTGEVGDVTEIWGKARTSIRLETNAGSVLTFETEVEEVIKRPKKSPRERR